MNIVSKENIRRFRNLRDSFIPLDIKGDGKTSEKTRELIGHYESIAIYTESEFSAWLEQKAKNYHQWFEQDNVTIEEAREFFHWGVQTLVRQLSRYESKHAPLVLTPQEIVQAYAFDFFRSLNDSLRLEINAKTALKIARFTYLNGPMKIAQLREQYEDIPQYGQNVAFTKSNRKPKEFLDVTRQHAQVIQAEFPNLSVDLAMSLSIKMRELDDVRLLLVRVEQLLPQAHRDYKHLPPFTVYQFVVRYLEEYPQKLDELQQRANNLATLFSEFSKDFLLAFCSTADRSFDQDIKELQNYQKKKSEILEVYPNLSLTLLGKALERKKPLLFIQEYFKSVARLENDFPDLPTYFIKDVRLKSNEKTSRQTLNEFYDFFSKNKDKYDFFSRSALIQIFVREREPQQELEKLANTFLNLRSKLTDLPNYILVKAVIYHPTDSERKIHSLKDENGIVEQIQQKFPNIQPSLAWHIGLSYEDWEVAAKTFSEKLLEMRKKYPLANHSRVEALIENIGIDNIEQAICDSLASGKSLS